MDGRHAGAEGELTRPSRITLALGSVLPSQACAFLEDDVDQVHGVLSDAPEFFAGHGELGPFNGAASATGARLLNGGGGVQFHE